MDFEFRRAIESELGEALLMLKNTAISLQGKKVNQWEFWLNPSDEKIDWIKEGFRRNEFYFITLPKEIIGMFRLLDEDLLYWGKETEKAKYIHSLVIKEKYSGNKLGEKVIEELSKKTMKEGVYTLRLDCNSGNQKLCKYYEYQGFIKMRQKQMPDSLNNLYQKRLIA